MAHRRHRPAAEVAVGIASTDFRRSFAPTGARCFVANPQGGALPAPPLAVCPSALEIPDLVWVIKGGPDLAQVSEFRERGSASYVHDASQDDADHLSVALVECLVEV